MYGKLKGYRKKEIFQNYIKASNLRRGNKHEVHFIPAYISFTICSMQEIEDVGK